MSVKTFPRKRAAGVALICGKLVLLGKRVEFIDGVRVPFGGYWSVFGGAIDPDESVISCAVRELKEETNIKVNKADLKYIETFGKGEKEFTLHIAEVGELLTPVLNSEHSEYGWFEIDALCNLPDKIDSKIISSLEKYIKGGFSFPTSER